MARKTPYLSTPDMDSSPASIGRPRHRPVKESPPKARPAIVAPPKKRPLTPSAARIDTKFGAGALAPGLGGRAVSAARGAPTGLAGSTQPASKARSAVGMPFTDRAKVAQAKTKAKAAGPTAKAAAPTKSTASAAPAKESFASRSAKLQQRLAKERMLKASNK